MSRESADGNQLSRATWDLAAASALAEDRARDDVTTSLIAQAHRKRGRAQFIAEKNCVIAGTPILEAVYRALDVTTTVDVPVDEGAELTPGDLVAEVTGPASALLAGERVALNFMQHLSGIASITREVVRAVEGTGARITDTRKTTPGLRALEKYAVRAGGGDNHRLSLADQVLWKDNHWQLLAASGEELGDALRRVPLGTHVIVEVEDWDQVETALAAGVRHLMLDNRTPEEVAAWVARVGDEVVLEVSGGITPETARQYADAGAHRISIGALTHTVVSIPIRCDLDFPNVG